MKPFFHFIVSRVESLKPGAFQAVWVDWMDSTDVWIQMDTITNCAAAPAVFKASGPRAKPTTFDSIVRKDANVPSLFPAPILVRKWSSAVSQGLLQSFIYLLGLRLNCGINVVASVVVRDKSS